MIDITEEIAKTLQNALKRSKKNETINTTLNDLKLNTDENRGLKIKKSVRDKIEYFKENNLNNNNNIYKHKVKHRNNDVDIDL